jgi:hypothetical protein
VVLSTVMKSKRSSLEAGCDSANTKAGGSLSYYATHPHSREISGLFASCTQRGIGDMLQLGHLPWPGHTD